jgi:nuclear GTP-binding protein
LINKLIDKCDVILYLLDARDPISCISNSIINKIREYPNKKIIYILNKIDLIPEELIFEWLKILKKSYPTVPFKANLQKSQKSNYSDLKLYSKTLKNASFVSIDGKNESNKKLIENEGIINKNKNGERLNSLLSNNKTIGLDELLNLLKN